MRRRVILLTGMAVLGVAVAMLAHRANESHRADQLVGADPDIILADSALRDTAVTVGRPLFERNCAPCHGAQGRGSTARGIPDLTDGEWLYGEGKVSEIEQIVLHGIRSGDARGMMLADMPAYATATPYPREHIEPLRPGEIQDVATFLGSLHRSVPDPAAAARGKAIFGGRGGCWDCHGSDASGDPAIGAPSLADNVWLYGDGSQAAMARSIAYGRRGAMPAFSHALTAPQARAVAAYAATLSQQNRNGRTHAQP